MSRIAPRMLRLFGFAMVLSGPIHAREATPAADANARSSLPPA